MTVKGDVTCLDVRGNRIGLFYPIQSSDPAVFAKLGFGIYISLTVDGNGKAKSVQFLPLPVNHLASCAPIPTIVPAQGTGSASS